jgi:hypothetical protein
MATTGSMFAVCFDLCRALAVHIFHGARQKKRSAKKEFVVRF